MENINASMVEEPQSGPSTSAAKKYSRIHVKLAEKSDAPDSDSDRSSMYDSVNEVETGLWSNNF